MFAVALLALGATITLIFNSAPTDARLISYFFVSLFVTILGLFFFLLLLINFWRFKSVPPWQSTTTSARYAGLLAGFLTVALLLRSFKLWNIATSIVLVIIILVLDLLWRRKLNWKKAK